MEKEKISVDKNLQEENVAGEKAALALNHEQVMDILPHRPPMLLVDEVLSLVPMESIQAKLTIDPSWDVFKGHFPGSPIFPGVLSVECMAQASDIMMMTSEKYAGLTPLFASIGEAKFLKGVLPGDVVIATSKVAEINEAKAKITCKAELRKENGDLAATATLTIAMR